MSFRVAYSLIKTQSLETINLRLRGPIRWPNRLVWKASNHPSFSALLINLSRVSALPYLDNNGNEPSAVSSSRHDARFNAVRRSLSGIPSARRRTSYQGWAPRSYYSTPSCPFLVRDPALGHYLCCTLEKNRPTKPLPKRPKNQDLDRYSPSTLLINVLIHKHSFDSQHYESSSPSLYVGFPLPSDVGRLRLWLGHPTRYGHKYRED